jgi:hypothetical protein
MRRLYLLVFVVTLIGVLATPASARTRTVLILRGQTVKATFFLTATDSNGCTFQNRIDLIASMDEMKSNSTPNVVQSGAVVFVDQDTLCPLSGTPTPGFHGNGSVSLAPNQLSIDGGLGSAKLRQAAVPIYDNTTNELAFTLRLNLSWSATGSATRTISSSVTPPPCEIEILTVDKQRNAVSAGAIDFNGTPFAQVVSADAHIMVLRQSTVSKGC